MADKLIDVPGLSSKQQGFQFGAQNTFKGPDGRLYYATTRQNPNTGKIEVVAEALPAGFEQTGAYGQTAGERVGQVGHPGTGD